jgi:hypothetical protein
MNNNELEGVYMDVNVHSWNLPEESHENLKSGYQASLLRFEPSTSRIQAQIFISESICSVECHYIGNEELVTFLV